MFANAAAALALFASIVAAQSNATTIDPNSVSLTLRTQWCAGEISTCGTLCSGSVGNNTCDPTTLSYSCTCAANNSAPGLQYYTQSLPSLICEQVYANCISANVGDAAAQTVCKNAEEADCGHLDAANFTAATTTTTTSSSSASAAATSAASTSTSKAAAATMVAMGREYGVGVVAAGFAAAFGFML